jgi:NAD kinase
MRDGWNTLAAALACWPAHHAHQHRFCHSGGCECWGDTRAQQVVGRASKLQTFWLLPCRLHLHIDFVVCLGGDGVLLHASALFKRAIPPVICFNLGASRMPAYILVDL